MSRQWESKIEEALNTCDALAAFLHGGFNERDWTDHEVGYCVGRRVPIIPLRFDIDPYGFMSRYQAAPCMELDEEAVATTIYDALLGQDQIGERAVDALIEALAQAESYAAANRRVTLRPAFVI